MNDMLRPKEVCSLLGISNTTLRRWLKSGQINIRTARTVGGHLRYNFHDVVLLTQRLNTTNPEPHTANQDNED